MNTSYNWKKTEVNQQTSDAPKSIMHECTYAHST